MSRPASAFRSLADVWLHRVTSTPDTDAFRGELDGRARVIGWAGAARTVSALAHGLRALGVHREERVLVVSEPRFELILVDFGAWCAGAAVSAWDPRAPDDDLVERCVDIAPAVIVADGPAAVRVAALRDRLPSVRAVISLDPVDAPGVRLLADVEAEGLAFAEAPFERLVLDVLPSQVATVGFTDGARAEPRGVTHTHEAWVAMADMIESARLLRPTDQVLTCLAWADPASRAVEVAAVRLGVPLIPLGRLPDLALLQQLAPSVVVGGPEVFVRLAAELEANLDERAVHTRVLLDVARRRVIRAQPRGFVPRVVHASLRRAGRLALQAVKARLGPRLRIGICVGSLAPEVGELFLALGVPILGAWGQAETGGLTCVDRRDRPRLGTVGPPLPGAHVAVGVGGELLVASPATMRGYWERPQETGAAFSADGLLYTGRAGAVRPSGEVEVDGDLRRPPGDGPPNTRVATIEARLEAACPWIESALLFGDGRPHLVALLAPRLDELFAWANEHGVPYVAAADLVSRPEVVDRVWSAIEPALRDLPARERVRRLAVLPEPFTRTNGLRGPSGEVRRAAVAARYASVLAEISLFIES